MIESVAQWQYECFFGVKCERKYIAKGRRLGFTEMALRYAVVRMLEPNLKVLWVDTMNSNLDRYMKRVLCPVLSRARIKYNYSSQKKELSIGSSVMDLRSADRPENMEGFAYNLIIINEAGIVLKNSSLYYNTILPMFMDYKNSEMIVGGTPKGKKSKGEEHVFYTLHKKAVPYDEYILMPVEKRQNVKEIAFTYDTYQNPFMPVEKIDDYVKSVPSVIRDQEIKGKFISIREKPVFKASWFKYYTLSSLNLDIGQIIQSWDTAFETGQENDYSVCTTWLKVKHGHYLLDLYKGQIDYPDLIAKVKDLYNRWKPTKILIEKKASGHSLLQSMRRETRLPVIEVNVKNDKFLRATECSPQFECGNVYFPEGAHFLSEMVDELEEFPQVEHDDVTDSITQYLNNNDLRLNGEIVTDKRQNLTTGY
jgi:predicted phage terminase large subunit-like protein